MYRVQMLRLLYDLRRQNPNPVPEPLCQSCGSTGRARLTIATPPDRKITLELDDAAKDWLGAKGYDPAYGINGQAVKMAA
jgi:hypothetical protein